MSEPLATTATTSVFAMSLPVTLRLFSDLLNRPVTGDEIRRVNLTDDAAFVRGVFLEGRTPSALFLLDVGLAAAAAAALVMMPPHLVDEAVQSRRLPPVLAENCLEVLNVASRLINRAGGAHYRLIGQLLPGEPTPSEVLDVVALVRERIDLRLTVEGYGTGTFTILVR